MTIGSDSLGPFFFGEDVSVIVNEKCQVIVDQVLSRDSKVKRIKVLKFATKNLQSSFRNVTFGRIIRSQENIRPNIIRHILGINSGRPNSRTIKGSLMKQMSNSIIGHVDSRIRKRLNQPFRIPRQPSA